MKQEKDKRIEAFVNACHQVAAYGLLRCSSGNMSYRLDANLVVLTASRSWLAELAANDVSICNLKDGRCVNDKIPTVENSFHLGILRNRTEVNVVLHFQSPFATAIACGNPRDYNFFVIPEIPYYIGQPAVVEYTPPGSVELAEAVVSAANGHNMVILRNHGIVAVGKDFEDVIQKAVIFELACQILLYQNKPRFLTQSDIDALTKP